MTLLNNQINQHYFNVLVLLVEEIDNNIVTGKRHYYKKNPADNSKTLLFTLDEAVRAILDKSLINNN